MQSHQGQLGNLKKKRRRTPFTIGVVMVCVFVISGILAVVAQVIVYYPLWLFAVILFIAGVFLLMVEIVLVYALTIGKHYGFQGEEVEEADDEDPGDFREHQRTENTADA